MGGGGTLCPEPILLFDVGASWESEIFWEFLKLIKVLD